jgi:hypothetical protein
MAAIPTKVIADMIMAIPIVGFIIAWSMNLLPYKKTLYKYKKEKFQKSHMISVWLPTSFDKPRISKFLQRKK